MKKTGKWIRAAVIFLCLLFAASYFLIRPVAVGKLEPLLEEVGAERINGTLAWSTVDLDPLYDLEFKDLELRDAEGRVVFRSPALKVSWTLAGAFSAWKNGDGVSAMIQDVVLDRPEIHAAENPDGTWNVQSLLKPQQDTSPSVFRGRVLMKDGTAGISLQAAGLCQIEHMEGQFSWMNEGSISAALSGEFSEAHFDARLSYTDETHFSVDASTDAVALQKLQPFLKYLPAAASSVAMKTGTVQVTKAELQQQGDALTYTIDGKLEGAALSVDSYEVTEGNTQFSVVDGNAHLQDASFCLNGQRVAGDMDISWAASPKLKGYLKMEDADLAQLFPGREMEGRLSGSIHLSGPISDMTALSGDGELSLTDGRIRGVEVRSGNVQASLQDGQLYLSSLDVETADGHLQGAGSYNVRTGDFQIRAAADHFDLTPLAPETGAAGIVTGSLTASGQWNGGAPVFSAIDGAATGIGLSWNGYEAESLSADFQGNGDVYSVRFYGNGLSGEGVHADSVAGELEGNGENWQINYLNGTVGGGAFSLRGRYAPEQMDLTVQAGHIEAAPFAALAGEDFGGMTSASGHISGTLEHPAFDLSFSVTDGHYQEASFRRLAGELTSDGEWVTIRRAEMETQTGRHTLTGRIGLSAPHPLEIEEKSEHTRIENVLKLAGIDAPLTGWFQNETTIRGTMDAPEISGRFMAWDGSAAGELYQSLSADYAVKDDGQLSITNGLAYIYGGAAYLNGTVSEKALDLEAALIDVDIERILRTGPAKGRVTFRGHISGSITSPIFDGQMSSRQISVNGSEIEQITAGVSYEDQVFRITDGFFRQRDGRFRWSGLVNAETGAMSGRLRFYGWSMEEALRFFQLPVSHVSGSMNGGMFIRGTMDDPEVSLNINLNGGSLGETPMGDGRFNLSYVNGLLSIQECYLPVGNGILAAKGTIQNGGAVDLTAAANHMDVSWIPQVLGISDLTLGGDLTAGITLSGTLKDPSADISITVTDPKYNGIAFDSLSLMGNAEKGAFQIDQLLATKGVYKASAHGVVPVSALTRIDNGRNIPFDVDVDLDNADLNALVFMADSVTSASGPVKGHLKISGPWNDPTIQGGAVVRDGQLTAEPLAEPVTNIDGTLLFSGKEAELNGQAELGGGTVSAAVRTGWDHMQLTGYAGEAHAHLPNLNSAYYKGRLDADMTLTEERNLPKVAGTINVEEAVVDIPMSFESSGESPDLLLDVSVNVGDDVRLYNSLLYDMTVRGNVRAMGLMARPVTSGRVTVDKGTIKYLSNEFNITEGTAVWGGVPDSFLPVLNVKANTTVGHYKVGMDLSGPPGGFIFNLHSEPSLNDTQIVTLLTLRQAPGSAEEDSATGALFNAGLSMVFSGGVQDLIRNTFGLDLISVTSSLTDYYSSSDSGLNDDYYYIKIGKYLFNDFMLTATMGVNNDEQSYGFRYDLKSRIGLAAWYNNDHDSYVGADYQFQF